MLYYILALCVLFSYMEKRFQYYNRFFLRLLQLEKRPCAKCWRMSGLWGLWQRGLYAVL